MIVTILVMTFTLVVDDKALAVSAPEKVKEVDCPPSYVGQKKCYMVVNPETRPKKVIKPSTPLPKGNKSMRKLPSGKSLTGNPIYYVAGVVGTVLALQDSELKTYQEWLQSPEVEGWASRVAGGISEKSAVALETAWSDMQTSGSQWLDLSNVVYEEMFGIAYGEMSKEAYIASIVARATTPDYKSEPSAQSFMKAMSEYFTEGYYFTSVGYDYELAGSEMKKVIKYKGYGSNAYNKWGTLQVSHYTWQSSHFISTFFNLSKKEIDEMLVTDYYKDFFYKPDGQGVYYPSTYKGNETSPYVVNTGSGVSTYVPPSYHGNVNNPTTETEVQIGSDTGKTYIEVPNPAGPDLEPDLQPKPERSKPNTPVIPGTKIVTEDGQEINPDGTVKKEPIVTPITIPNPNPSPSPNPNPSPSPAPQPAPLPPKTEAPPTSGEEPDPDSPNRNPDDDGNRFGALVTNKFPFSLPWDIYNMIAAVVAEPERPEVKVDLSGQTFMGISAPIKFSHDFKWMDDYAPFMRTFILIGFTIFLIISTRRLMGGGQ